MDIAICKCLTQMYTPFVNQSAPHESTQNQNDNCRRSFTFRDVLILYISQYETIVFMWPLNVSK